MISNEKRVLSLFSTFFIACFLWVFLSPCPLGAEQTSVKEIIIDQIVQYIKAKNVRIPDATLRRMAETVYTEARLYALDYRLLLAVIKVESNFRQDAVSAKGARGLMQVKPSLAKYIAKDAGVSVKGAACLSEPDKNVRLGVYYLSRLMEDFEDLGQALHAYNTGPARLKKKPVGDAEPKNRFARRVLKEYQSTIELLPEDN